ncbi:MAG: hypothetical protein GY796_18015 [Chloroflexi bacterium]|nr:hypothetical protein [Chloroflexota bacterium]
MSGDLLQTKLYVPRLRPFPISSKSSTGACKLTLVSAPVGYGKMTLVTEWIEQIRGKTAVSPPPHFPL